MTKTDRNKQMCKKLCINNMNFLEMVNERKTELNEIHRGGRIELVTSHSP